MSRKIDNRIFLTYLLKYLNVNDLKQVCRDFNLKGYSRLKKDDLIEFILDSLAEEEMIDLLQQRELDIISDGIKVAMNKINGSDRESINNIKIVNQDAHEIEISFKGMSWKVESFLSITSDNIDNPERDCDCRIGSNMGFCNHFWVGFIFSLKKEWFNIKDWTLTKLPDNFAKMVSPIKLSDSKGDDMQGSFNLVDESSEDFQVNNLLNNSITVYESEVGNIEQKESEFQGNTTIYYLIDIKNVRVGPRIQRKSDFSEEDIINLDELTLRISEKVQNDNELKLGDKITGNGKLMKDNFLNMLVVKNIRKITKL